MISKKVLCLENSSIDGYIRYFQDHYVPQDLSNFFQFNDLLDSSRKVRLADYIPELDLHRNRNYNTVCPKYEILQMRNTL